MRYNLEISCQEMINNFLGNQAFSVSGDSEQDLTPHQIKYFLAKKKMGEF